MKTSRCQAALLPSFQDRKPRSRDAMLVRAWYSIVGIALLVISCSGTWLTMERLSENFAPRFRSTAPVGWPQDTPAVEALPTATNETPQAELPLLTTPGVTWAGIAGLNVQRIEQSPAVAGEPVLRLTAVPKTDRHTLVAKYTGLPKGLYRVAIWVKPLAGANFALEAADLARSHGSATFDLAEQRVLVGPARSGIEQGGDGWQKVWIDLRTSTGQLIVAMHVTEGIDGTFQGNGKRGVVFGGLAADRLSSITIGPILLGFAAGIILIWVSWCSPLWYRSLQRN